jgi:hypothetical protein
MEKITIGRIVHFIMPDGNHRPAIVVEDWKGKDDHINLQVFLDGDNDLSAPHHERQYGSAWRTSVKYAPAKKNEPGTFHWPEGTEKKGEE